MNRTVGQYDIGLYTPDLKLYEYDANTLSLENLAGGTRKNIRVGDINASTITGTTSGGNVFLVAGVDAPADIIRHANYLCDGTADDIEINAAITALAGARGTVKGVGTFTLTNHVVLASNLDFDFSDATIEPVNGGTATHILVKALNVSRCDIRIGDLNGLWRDNSASIGLDLDGVWDSNIDIYGEQLYLLLYLTGTSRTCAFNHFKNISSIDGSCCFNGIRLYNGPTDNHFDYVFLNLVAAVGSGTAIDFQYNCDSNDFDYTFLNLTYTGNVGVNFNSGNPSGTNGVFSETFKTLVIAQTVAGTHNIVAGVTNAGYPSKIDFLNIASGYGTALELGTGSQVIISRVTYNGTPKINQGYDLQWNSPARLLQTVNMPVTDAIKNVIVQLDTKSYDLGTNLTVGDLYGTSTTYRVSTTGGNATTLVDSAATFTTAQFGSTTGTWIHWASTADGGTNPGQGYAYYTDAHTLALYKSSGAAFANLYYYWIQKCYYSAPIAGYYQLNGFAGIASGEDGKRYYLLYLVNGGATNTLAGAEASDGAQTVRFAGADLIHLNAGDTVMLAAGNGDATAGTCFPTSCFMSIYCVKAD